MKALFLSLLILMGAGTCLALTPIEASHTGSLVATGPYRYMQADSTHVAGAAGGANVRNINFRFNADFIFLAWSGSTNDLHVQFITSDDDTTYIRKGDVSVINADEAIPIYGRDISAIRFSLPYNSDSGVLRFWAYKI
jgi:hypothetical protein